MQRLNIEAEAAKCFCSLLCIGEVWETCKSQLYFMALEIFKAEFELSLFLTFKGNICWSPHYWDFFNAILRRS